MAGAERYVWENKPARLRGCANILKRIQPVRSAIDGAGFIMGTFVHSLVEGQARNTGFDL